MNRIIHRTKPNGNYDLVIEATVVALANKTEDGFYAQTLYGDRLEARTMAALKEQMGPLFEDWQGLGVRKEFESPLHFTVAQAKAIAGLSHTRIKMYMREIHTCHPYIKRHEYAGYMILQALSQMAKWDWGTYERKWLAENGHRLPKVRTLDVPYFERFRKVRYLD